MSRVSVALIASIALLVISPLFSAGKNKSADNSGHKLIDKYGCMHCHLVGGKGGTVAPPLDGIKNFRDRKYILQRISGNDRSLPDTSRVPESFMNHIAVPLKDRARITDYILTLKPDSFMNSGHGTGATDQVPQGSQFVPLPASESTLRGSEAFKEGGCIACHSIGSIGGHLGPNLSGVGARRSRNFIEMRIKVGATLLPSGQKGTAGYAMPPQDVCEEHLKDLVDFLLTLPPVPSKTTVQTTDRM